MKLQNNVWLFLFAILICSAAFAQEHVPPGTVVPAMLNSTIFSQRAKPRQLISARVMQDVPLPNKMRIREGSRIVGHIIDVRPGSPGNPAQLSFEFDQLRLPKRTISVKTDLRALASLSAVEDAQLPLRGMGEGDSWNGRTTVQVGGDVAYWGGGPLEGPMGIVGKPITGTDTDVLGKVTSNSEGGCRGQVAENRSDQALWVFSSDACGVYGLDDVTIARSGRSDPLGVVELTSKRDTVKIPGGSGMLLRIIDGSQ